jgi:hypothetical protein
MASALTLTLPIPFEGCHYTMASTLTPTLPIPYEGCHYTMASALTLALTPNLPSQKYIGDPSYRCRYHLYTLYQP